MNKLNPFEFKIPCDLKDKIANHKASLTITYQCDDKRIYKIITVDKYETASYFSWNELVAKHTFEEWYEKIKW